jgi:hypothetical protein
LKVREGLGLKERKRLAPVAPLFRDLERDAERILSRA